MLVGALPSQFLDVQPVELGIVDIGTVAESKMVPLEKRTAPCNCVATYLVVGTSYREINLVPCYNHNYWDGCG